MRETSWRALMVGSSKYTLAEEVGGGLTAAGRAGTISTQTPLATSAASRAEGAQARASLGRPRVLVGKNDAEASTAEPRRRASSGAQVVNRWPGVAPAATGSTD